jgi:RNA polymerase sigma-70 factor (ECF subfamily)
MGDTTLPAGDANLATDAVGAARATDRRAALIQLMRTHGDAIYGLCVHMVKDPVLAEDLLQQVFEQAYRDLASFRGGSSLRTWLVSIANHRCLDAIKARRRASDRFVSVDEIPEVGEAPDASAVLDVRQVQRHLGDCLDALAPAARMAVLLRYQEGLSFEEISRISREKPGTLQARVARAMVGLRACLQKKGVEP